MIASSMARVRSIAAFLIFGIGAVVGNLACGRISDHFGGAAP